MADTASSSASDDPNSGSSKKSKIADTVNGDVISTLPDEVLCHLLSFIPTKHAVSTSVLSKRWKLLWTSIPNLDFSFNDDSPVNRINFMNFVDRVLSMNNVLHVQNFYLVCSDDCDSSRVKAWTSAIAERDMKYFNLRIPISCCIEKLDQISQIVSLPDRFFIGRNLIQLVLENVALKAPTSVDFPSLKTMFLTSVQFLDEASVKILLAGCPVLETFFLTRCGMWDNAKTLYICSPTLSSLNLQNEHCKNKTSGYKVLIEAPKLMKLNLTDYVNLDCDMNNISSLVEAYVDFELDERVAMDGEGEAYNGRVFEFFRKISQIQELNIGSIAMRALESANMENMPKFNNLTSLTVLLNLKSSLILLDLFHCLPNLVSFLLEMDNVHPDCEWYEPDHVPQCLLSSLENIEITEFEECDAEMEMVFYFLSNAMVLKKMKIVSFHLDIETEVDILKQLVNFPRSSSTCEVDYTNYCFKENENGSFEEAEGC